MRFSQSVSAPTAVPGLLLIASEAAQGIFGQNCPLGYCALEIQSQMRAFSIHGPLLGV